MKKILCLGLCFTMFFTGFVFADDSIEISAPSAILLDVNGNIIFEKNSHEQREPASVTKIMTMLLTMEALDSGKISLDDMVCVSANAASQGGTQVFLSEGELISVDELLKSVAVSSANDAAMALGEHISGSKESFVDLMNNRASELGMNDTNFANPTGLDADGHVTSAYDIAMMSVELLKHENIYNYTTIWVDSIRGGEFELANTNKLLRTYDGLVGLKTGFTSNAMYCISAVAKRLDQMFIAVCMGAESTDSRSADITKMLDYAFANYKIYSPNIPENIGKIEVINGEQDFVEMSVVEKVENLLILKENQVVEEIIIPENIVAPILEGDKIGELVYKCGENTIGKLDIIAKCKVDELSFSTVLSRFIKSFFIKK